jgi:peptidoglycan/LPS O-acetylase OafA/YrhL
MKSEPITAHIGLRGIAATVVFIAHVDLAGQFPEWSWLKTIYPAFMWHHHCVDLFFILSGFILNWVYLAKPQVNWKSYGVARVARIYPLYFAALGFMLLVDAYSLFFHGITVNDLHLSRLLPNLLMLTGFSNDPTMSSINVPSWSVSVEIVMYVSLFPLLCFLERRFTKMAWFALMLVCVIGTQLCYIYPEALGWPYIARGIFGFALGFACCSLWRKSDQTNMPAYFGWAAVVLALLSITHIVPATIKLACFPAIVVATISGGGSISKALSTRCLVWLGDRSYSLYLWHYPMIICFSRFLLYNHSHDGVCALNRRILAYCLITVSAFAMADASYRWFECPAREWIRGKLR